VIFAGLGGLIHFYLSRFCLLHNFAIPAAVLDPFVLKDSGESQSGG